MRMDIKWISNENRNKTQPKPRKNTLFIFHASTVTKSATESQESNPTFTSKGTEQVSVPEANSV
jgi:hypothetical protein